MNEQKEEREEISGRATGVRGRGLTIWVPEVLTLPGSPDKSGLQRSIASRRSPR